jgi:hypothetical protein
MTRTLRLLALATVAVLGSRLPAYALGPLDVAVTAYFWNADSEVLGQTEASGDVGGRAEVWFKRLGFTAELFRLRPEDSLSNFDFDYTSLDVQWRLLDLTENNFLALGAGYEKVDIKGPGIDDNSSGPRIMAEGRVGLTSILWFYGRGAYMPDLSDLEAGAVTFTNGTAFEYEFGLQVKPFPFLQIYGGFRQHKDEFDVPLGTTTIKHDGILVGAGVNF